MVVLGPKDNGHIQVVPLSATGLAVVLPEDKTDALTWELLPYDETLLGLQGEPRFIPSTSDPNLGALVWTYDVLSEGNTELRLQLVDEAGVTQQLFHVLVSIQELVPTPY